MTNREKLRELNSKEFYFVLDRLLHCYGRAFSSTQLAVTEWFDKEYIPGPDSFDYPYIWSVLEQCNNC